MSQAGNSFDFLGYRFFRGGNSGRIARIGSLSEYEPILKIFAIYVKFSAMQSISLNLFETCRYFVTVS